MVFTDILYGKIELPDWLLPFLKAPEFVRLRGVRLSNVDSFQFKDFNGPTRWEHCIAVAYLAVKCVDRMKLDEKKKVHVILAALLHDIATPPFAHTIEYVLNNYDHEVESSKILSASASSDSHPSFPIFASQLPQFTNLCKGLSKKMGFIIEQDYISDLVTGGADLGYLINGTIDLDNIDNVTRASLFLGVNVDKSIPLQLVDWLSKQKNAPIDIKNEPEKCVQTWLDYRNQMYGCFFNSSDEELGRQAFLQHIIRRARTEGISRQALIWNTDESLLNLIENYSRSNSITYSSIHEVPLNELIQRYRLLETAYKFAEIRIEDEHDLEILKSPTAAAWIEEYLSSQTFEPFVLINTRRYDNNLELFPQSVGALLIFKLGETELKFKQLPDWVKDGKSEEMNNTIPKQIFTKMLKAKIPTLISEKPWLKLTPQRRDDIKTNLESLGNWSFRMSKNESIHSYPATFVHAIPASLITALGLKGETILDPFGGTGQTAVEGLKLGCKVISGDSNSIANLIAKTKLTYLSKEKRASLRLINHLDLHKATAVDKPNFDSIKKWHHPKTISELCKILGFIESIKDKASKQFLTTCFSDILTSCTARKGKEHGYFADNTPLSKGQAFPGYENAANHFLQKINRNIDIIERIYSSFEKNNHEPRKVLAMAKVLQVDITKAQFDDYKVEQHSISGIITSPPYLCMADYTLGQRLSYYWLFQDKISIDFENEIGARRNRTNSAKAISQYFADMKAFADTSASLLKKGGFLATIIGAPVATAFQDKNILGQLDGIFKQAGFDLLWENMRPIQWHRNHGYARLNTERIAVHVLK